MAKKNITLDELAVMIKHEFDGVHEKFDGKFDSLDRKFTGKFNELKRDMEEIKLKFAYTAWAIDVEELKHRVMIIEKKLGVK